MIQSFRDLTVWKKSIELATSVYRTSEKLPKSETYGLQAQLRRASVSIPANMAEGKGIGGRGYLRHLRIALGSEAELQTHIELAVRLKMLSRPEADSLTAQASEVGRMLVALLRSLLNREK